ncbi:hypothetical protein EDD52_103209 [Primorskyibacter sedentarius]|uniref:Uncharacterized protein n=1 Tax=Primorskyibacter sedentarius TaxID=745311 RepID=A0A4R3JIE8_9RHOB|nr:hypothetical protein [Primorskyibacter sedentarius]TCS65792.1 hypothetical protein EDD52_103209 [Primorskyibacter sedentarius]
MTQYDQLRATIRDLQTLRTDLGDQIARDKGQDPVLNDLHQRVCKALRALSGLS